MTEITITDKEDYLQRNYLFTPIPKLTDKVLCLHCGEVIIVGDYKVFRNQDGEEFICCPNAPKCDGNLMDWW